MGVVQRVEIQPKSKFNKWFCEHVITMMSRSAKWSVNIQPLMLYSDSYMCPSSTMDSTEAWWWKLTWWIQVIDHWFFKWESHCILDLWPMAWTTFNKLWQHPCLCVCDATLIYRHLGDCSLWSCVTLVIWPSKEKKMIKTRIWQSTVDLQHLVVSFSFLLNSKFKSNHFKWICCSCLCITILLIEHAEMALQVV